MHNPDFLNVLNNHDIIFLNECWTNKTDAFELNNYKCFHKHRKKSKRAKRNSGGLCIFLKNNIADFFDEYEWDFEDGFILKSKSMIEDTEKHLYIVFVYLRPSTSSRNEIVDTNDVYECLLDKLTLIRNLDEIILVGDFNARTAKMSDLFDTSFFEESMISDENLIAETCIEENDLSIHHIKVQRNNMDNKMNDYGPKLLKLCQISGMFICNGRIDGDKEGNFTYIDKKGKSLIDYALLSKGLIKYVHKFTVAPLTIFSDHCPIILTMRNLLFKSFTTNNAYENAVDANDHEQPSLNNYFYKWNDDNCNLFLSRLENDFSIFNLNAIIDLLQDDSFHDKEDIDKCLYALETVIDYAAKPFLATLNKNKENSHYNQNVNNDWYDLECRTKKREFDLAIDIYKETNDDDDLKRLCSVRNSYRLLCRQKKRKCKERFANDLVKLSKENSRQFWKKIKRKKKKLTNPTCDFDFYFRNLFENTTATVSDDINDVLNEYNQLDNVLHDVSLDRDFTMDELEKAIKKLNNNKSPGSDFILNEFLKNNTFLFKKALLIIFNTIFDTGIFPSSWTLGLIVPIHKKGDVNSAENYRGISLISCMSKLFTNMINIRLNKWAESNSHLDNFQFGFRDKRSTVDAIFLLQSTVEYFLSQKKKLYVSFIDLKKAFDKTHHNALWYKLHENNVSTKTVNIIKNMYENVKLCVKNTFMKTYANKKCCCDNEYNFELISKPCVCFFENYNFDDDCYFTPAAGVLQGESLSPLLFLCTLMI